jgi:hypothetical protein
MGLLFSNDGSLNSMIHHLFSAVTISYPGNVSVIGAKFGW